MTFFHINHVGNQFCSHPLNKVNVHVHTYILLKKGASHGMQQQQLWLKLWPEKEIVVPSFFHTIT